MFNGPAKAEIPGAGAEGFSKQSTETWDEGYWGWERMRETSENLLLPSHEL